MPREMPKRGRLVVALGGTLAAFSPLMMAGWIFHAWLADPGRNPFPGRPAFATAFGMVLAGIGFVLGLPGIFDVGRGGVC